jgi:ubiquinone/menaquinone biosynthesis C-methylase UbiE
LTVFVFSLILKIRTFQIYTKTKEEVRKISASQATQGLYQTIVSILRKSDLSPDDVIQFITHHKVDERTIKRLMVWLEELRFWREYALIYRNLEKARPYSQLAKTFEDLIRPEKGDVWLDVGCGPAKMSQLVWKKSGKSVRKIIGIDIVLSPAQETLSRLTEKIPVELVYASIGETLPFSDNSFDGIIANLIFPYVTDFEGRTGKEAFRQVLSEMYRVLKPGGHIVWSTPKQSVRFQWVFIASIPDMLNPIPYILQKDVTRILQGVRILKHALEIQKKGRQGIYTFLPMPEVEEILKEIGFSDLVWQSSFVRQVLVNKAHKPHN